MNSNMDLHQQQQQEHSSQNQNPDDLSLKLAVAMSLLRSKLLQNQTSHPPPLSSPPLSHHRDALRWKKKAKERKQEILKLRQDLNELEEASRYDPVSQVASCKCYFFENLGKFSPKRLGDGSDHKFTDVLRRRFLRQVRFKERRKRDGGNQKQHLLDLSNEDEAEQLNAAVEFLVELCDRGSSVEVPNFANWSHQAVDFIIASLRNLLTKGEILEMIEGIVSIIISRLIRRMCNPGKEEVLRRTNDGMQHCAQHLIRKLGNEIYIGQRAVLAVSQKISAIAESLLFIDPFDDSFSQMHESMFLLMQLLEFLISDYILTWSATESFDNLLFEEWLTSIVHARKAVELLESRNGLYVLYMDRVIGELSKRLAQIPSLLNLNAEGLNMLLI